MLLLGHYVEKGVLPERVALRFRAIDQARKDEADAEAFAEAVVAPADHGVPPLVDAEVWARAPALDIRHWHLIWRGLVPRSFIGGLIGLKIGLVIGALVAIAWLAPDALLLVGGFGAALGAVMGCAIAAWYFERARPPVATRPAAQKFSLVFTPSRLLVKTGRTRVREMPLAEVRELRADRLHLQVADTAGTWHTLPIVFASRDALVAITARANALLVEARTHVPRGYRG